MGKLDLQTNLLFPLIRRLVSTVGKQSQNAINKVSTSGNMTVFPTEGINVSNSGKIFPPLETFLSCTLRKMCPYSKLFWSTFFRQFPAFGLNTEKYRENIYKWTLSTQRYQQEDWFAQLQNVSPLVVIHYLNTININASASEKNSFLQTLIYVFTSGKFGQYYWETSLQM